MSSAERQARFRRSIALRCRSGNQPDWMIFSFDLDIYGSNKGWQVIFDDSIKYK
jgi:hypothetical protein